MSWKLEAVVPIRGQQLGERDQVGNVGDLT